MRQSTGNTMNKIKCFCFLFILLLCSNCATTGSVSNTGYAFIGIRTESGVFSYDKGDIEKKGESCSYNILGFLAFENSGIQAAKQEGKINKISYIDTEIINIGPLFGLVCTVAYGK